MLVYVDFLLYLKGGRGWECYYTNIRNVLIMRLLYLLITIMKISEIKLVSLNYYPYIRHVVWFKSER